MRGKIRAAIISVIIITASLLFSCDMRGTPEITVKNAVLFPSPAMIGMGSAFLQIKNVGNGSDRLTGCSFIDMPSVKGELHEVKDGKMVKIEEVKVPGKMTIELKKGGMHIMFYHLPEELKDDIKLTLNFAKSGPIDVRTKVVYHK